MNKILPKVLIVNWGTQSSDHAFRTAYNKGLEIYLATSTAYPEWILEFVKKDHLIFTNTYDPEKLLIDVVNFMNAKKVKFDGITTFFEMNVIQTSDLANTLGYPFITPMAARKSSANKLMMKTICLRYNIKSPNFRYFNYPDKGYKYLKEFGTPSVIKPVKSGHSYGIRYIPDTDRGNFMALIKDAEKELDLNIDEWMAWYKEYRNDYILEEYTPGNTISIDGLIQNKNIFFAGITEFITSPLPDFVQECVTIPANTPKKVKNKYYAFAGRIIKSFGFDNCAFHAEFILTKGELSLLEIAARPPGGNMTLAYKNATGIDIIGLYLDICLGKKIKFPKVRARRVIVHRSLFTSKEGEIVKIKVPVSIKKNKHIKFFWLAKKGDFIGKVKGQLPSLAYFEISAGDHNIAESLRLKTEDLLKFTIRKTPRYLIHKFITKFSRQ